MKERYHRNDRSGGYHGILINDQMDQQPDGNAFFDGIDDYVDLGNVDLTVISSPFRLDMC